MCCVGVGRRRFLVVVTCFSQDTVEEHSNVDDDVVVDVNAVAVASIVLIVAMEASVEIPRNDLEFVFLKTATAFFLMCGYDKTKITAMDASLD